MEATYRSRERRRGRAFPVRVVHAVKSARTLRSLRVRDFRLLWLTSWCSSSSAWVESIVLGWLTYQVTASALLTTLSFGLGTLPAVVIGPLGGVFIDRCDRRSLFRAALVAHVVLTAALSAVILLGSIEAWHIFAFLFVNGGVRTLRSIIETSLIPNIVPPRLITNGFSLFMLTGSVSRFIVPVMTGVALARIGAGPTFVFSTVLYVLAMVAWLRSEFALAPTRERGETSSVLSDMRQAFAFLGRERHILALYTPPILLMLFLAPINLGLMPVYVAEVFRGGPQALGLIVCALGAGMTLGTLVLASMGETRSKARVMTLFSAAAFVAILAFTRITFLPVALAMVSLYSVFMMMVYVVSSAAIQKILPDAMRGRVTSLLGAATLAFPLGALALGNLAQRIGAQDAAVIAVIAFGALVALYAVWQRKMIFSR